MQAKGWIVGGPKGRGDQGMPYEFAATEDTKRARAEASGCTWTPSEKDDQDVQEESERANKAVREQGSTYLNFVDSPLGGRFANI